MLLIDLLLSRLLSEAGIATLFVMWVLYQVYSPDWMPNTKFQQVAADIRGDIQETRHLLVSTVTVLRAVVRTNDEIDTEKVDDYLVENGVEPDDFIRGTDMRDHKYQEPGDD